MLIRRTAAWTMSCSVMAGMVLEKLAYKLKLSKQLPRVAVSLYISLISISTQTGLPSSRRSSALKWDAARIAARHLFCQGTCGWQESITV